MAEHVRWQVLIADAVLIVRLAALPVPKSFAVLIPCDSTPISADMSTLSTWYSFVGEKDHWVSSRLHGPPHSAFLAEMKWARNQLGLKMSDSQTRTNRLGPGATYLLQKREFCLIQVTIDVHKCVQAGAAFGSGRDHCDLALAVEARRGTLWSWVCCSGPAGTTAITSLQLRSVGGGEGGQLT